METEVILSKEFVNYVGELSPVAVKCYIILSAAEAITNPDDGFIVISYETISSQSGIKSTKTIREAILELATNRWIIDYKRGGYKSMDDYRVNFPNRYKISRNKVDLNTAKNVYEKMKGKDKSENLPG